MSLVYEPLQGPHATQRRERERLSAEPLVQPQHDDKHRARVVAQPLDRQVICDRSRISLRSGRAPARARVVCCASAWTGRVQLA